MGRCSYQEKIMLTKYAYVFNIDHYVVFQGLTSIWQFRSHLRSSHDRHSGIVNDGNKKQEGGMASNTTMFAPSLMKIRPLI
jgi:hypothetical protein